MSFHHTVFIVDRFNILQCDIPVIDSMRDHLEVREGKPAGLWSDRLRIAQCAFAGIVCMANTLALDVYVHVSQKMRQQSAERMEQFIRKVSAQPCKIPERVGVRVNGQQKSLESLRFQGFYWQGRTL